MKTKHKGLSKRGINRLEKVMLENRKYYNQNVYGQETACGVCMCAAGFAYRMKVGEAQFNKEAKRESQAFRNRCVKAGRDLLGISAARIPQVFATPLYWPSDLTRSFRDARGPMGRVRQYIKMLRTRATADGELTF